MDEDAISTVASDSDPLTVRDPFRRFAAALDQHHALFDENHLPLDSQVTLRSALNQLDRHLATLQDMIDRQDAEREQALNNRYSHLLNINAGIRLHNTYAERFNWAYIPLLRMSVADGRVPNTFPSFPRFRRQTVYTDLEAFRRFYQTESEVRDFITDRAI